MPEISREYRDFENAEFDARQYGALFNNAVIGIVLINQEGEIIHVNQFAENQFGYTGDELIGKNVELLIPAKYSREHEKFWQHFYHDSPTQMIEEGEDLYALRKDGSEFPVEVSLSHFEQGGKNFAYVFIANITVQRNNEKLLFLQNEKLLGVADEVRQLNQALEKKVSDRSLIVHEALLALEKSQEELKIAYEKEKELGELKSRFVLMASHEFRTPLSTILSSVDLVKKYSATADEDKRNKHILKIQRAVKDLTYIMDDFLSLGKLEKDLVQATPEVLKTEVLLADMDDLVKEMRQASWKDQRIELSHSIWQDIFSVDRKLLRHILMNLVSNAIKYSSEKSAIMIHCSDEKGDLQISVCDEGIGIPEQDQEKLFERFFRASNVAGIQGTGLGLHIVGRYLDLMGGRITLKSKLNEGTTITIYIPQLVNMPQPAKNNEED
ncbi:MAG: PAS domain-containing sensor histidine kinase [Bacteroidota bacterium]|nr:PAS domain-containing sensor histidine kinase [Bacteroidota bacterium]